MFERIRRADDGTSNDLGDRPRLGEHGLGRRRGSADPASANASRTAASPRLPAMPLVAASPRRSTSRWRAVIEPLRSRRAWASRPCGSARTSPPPSPRARRAARRWSPAPRATWAVGRRVHAAPDQARRGGHRLRREGAGPVHGAASSSQLQPRTPKPDHASDALGGGDLLHHARRPGRRGRIGDGRFARARRQGDGAR